MAEVFISSASEDAAFADRLAEAVKRAGYSRCGNPGDDPKAVIVVWSRSAAASREVRAQAEAGRVANRLVQVSIDERVPPLPFSMLHCVALGDWQGEADHLGWSKVKERLEALAREWLPGTDSNHRPTG